MRQAGVRWVSVSGIGFDALLRSIGLCGGYVFRLAWLMRKNMCSLDEACVTVPWRRRRQIRIYRDNTVSPFVVKGSTLVTSEAVFIPRHLINPPPCDKYLLQDATWRT